MKKILSVFALISMGCICAPSVSYAAWVDDMGNEWESAEGCGEWGVGYCSDIGEDDFVWGDYDVDEQCRLCCDSNGGDASLCIAYDDAVRYECVLDMEGSCVTGDAMSNVAIDASSAQCQQYCNNNGEYYDYVYADGDFMYECSSCSTAVIIGGSGMDINCEYLAVLQDYVYKQGGEIYCDDAVAVSEIRDVHIKACKNDEACRGNILRNWRAYEQAMCKDGGYSAQCDKPSCEYLEIFMQNNPGDYDCEDTSYTQEIALGNCEAAYGEGTRETQACVANIAGYCGAYLDAYNMSPTDNLYDIGFELGLSCAGGPSCEYLEVFLGQNPGDYTCSDSAGIRDMVFESCEAEYGDSAEQCIANLVQNCQAYVDAYDTAGTDEIYDIGSELGLTCGAPTSMTCENCTCSYLENAYDFGIVAYGSGQSVECDTGSDMWAMCEQYVEKNYERSDDEDWDSIMSEYGSECEQHYIDNCVAYANAVYSDVESGEKRGSVEEAYSYLGLYCGDACAPGTYNDGGSCVECSAGYACAGGDAQPERCAYTTYAAAGADSCTACPNPNTHMLTTYPNVWYPVNADGTLNKTSFTVKASSLQNWGDIGDITTCRISYAITNAAGTLTDQGVGFNPSTQKYDVFDTSPTYYGSLKAGWYLSDRYSDTYCNDVSNSQLYAIAHQCPIGSYCPGMTLMPLCSDTSHDYVSNNTLGLEACPALEGYTAKTDSVGSTSYLQCYLEENKEFSDAKGTYHYTEKCYYED